LKTILEENGLFTVDVATSPAKGQPMDGFRPVFADYDVIVANYTGDSWPQATQEDLEAYMKNGGGLVIFHAADNAFPRWAEWNKMIALGGWGGRNEKSGPMVRYRDGKMVLDHSPGRGGSHGPQHAFQITLRDATHPITRGLPPQWMHVKDELYSTLRGPAQNMTLLATAYADPAQKGSGEHEPVLFTVQYGKGRVFHTVLGHGPEQLRCVCCIVLLQRGTEWAATGKVTQTAVPDDFPTADAVSLRLTSSSDYRAIETYDVGKSRAALEKIEAEIRTANRTSYPRIEDQLLAALDAPGTSLAGRQFCCRMLRRVGSAKSVPSLASLLADPELSHLARFALQHMSAPQAGRALRRALAQLDGELRIGVIGSLGARGDQRAIQSLAPWVTNPDAATARAAIQALGHIGGQEAAEVLRRATVADALEVDRSDAVLQCADALLDEGQARDAASLYRRFTGTDASTWIRIAAYRGLIQAEPDEAIPHVLALLKAEDLHLKRAASTFITQMPGNAITLALAKQLDTLNPEAQALLLSALETRADRVATPYVVKAAQSSNPAVQRAAIKALGTLGNGSTIALLATLSTTADPIGTEARESLNRIRGDDVTDALAAVLQSDAPAAIRVNVIDTCVRRHETDTVPTLRKSAQDSDPAIRTVATRALGSLATAGDMSFLVSQLESAESSSDRAALERAMVLVASRNPKLDVSPITAALKRAGPQVKGHLVTVLGVVGSDAALAAVRTQLDSSDTDLQKAAIRALSKWPNTQALPDLMTIARDSGDASQRILALRGYIQLLSQPSDRSAAETVTLLADAYEVAERTDEKRMVLSALIQCPSRAAIALAVKAQAEPALAREAEVAIKRISTLLQERQLNAQASHDNSNAQNALDKNPQTRWSTGRPMKPGDWFILDLGVESTVEGLTLDTRNSSNDYPREYEVYVSFGGGNWGEPILKDKGTKPLTEIRFPRPVTTRYIKILQKGSSDSWHWSIHELTIQFD
jgi:HEAT repeat protein/type 1 glutamine amidotransferase